MSTIEPTPADLINVREQHLANRYLLELARISAWLFLGVLALMTFLLTVGLQHPQPMFSYFCYASLIILPLNLLIFAVTNLLTAASASMSTVASDVTAKSDKSDDKDDDAKPKSSKKARQAAAGRTAWIKALRITQQLVFILSLIAVTGLGLVSAHIFFAPPAAASQAQQGE